jgi:glycosyltransferase involved in cell wall biosynthesis
MAPRVALVHDYLVARGGAERVLLSLASLYPGSKVFTALYRPTTTWPEFRDLDIQPLWPDRLPVTASNYRPIVPLYAAAFEALHLEGYDLVVSSSSAFAKSAGRRAARRVCYCHTPPRFVWPCGTSSEAPGPVEALGAALMKPAFRRLDRRAASRVDAFVANSLVVQERIRQFYGRESTVINPPVTLPAGPLAVEDAPRRFFLAVGRQVSYKRFDQVIHAASRLGVSLVLVGSGPETANLRALAGPTVSFLEGVPGEELQELFQQAIALVVPGDEDWGMTAIEANAQGCPVVGARRGGTVETVVEGVTGLLYTPDDLDALAAAMVAARAKAWNRLAIAGHAEGFSQDRFLRDFERIAAAP